MKQKKKTILSSTKKIVFTVIWILIIIKLFLYDIDLYVFHKLPTPICEFCIELRFFIILFLIAIVLLLQGMKRFALNLGLFFAFPFILLYYGLSIFFGGFSVFKKIRSFKYKFLTTILSIPAIYSILKFHDKLVIIISMVYLIMYLFLAFYYATVSLSAPLNIFSKINDFLKNFIKKYFTPSVNEEIAKLENLSEDNQKMKQERIKILSTVLGFVKIYETISTILLRLQGARVIVLYFLGVVLLIFTLTVVICGFEYYSLAHHFGDHFIIQSSDSIFEFFYFSFLTILSIDFGDITPISSWAKILVTFEIASGIYIAIMLFFIFTTIVLERYKDEVNILIGTFKTESDSIQTMINKEFKSEEITRAIEYMKREKDESKSKKGNNGNKNK